MRNRWFKYIFGLIVILASVIYLWQVGGELLSNPTAVQINWAMCFYAMLVTCLAILSGTTTWWFLLLSFSVKASWLQSAQAHLGPNLAKYLPGYGWQLLGKAYLTHQLGVPARRTGIILAIETALYILTGWGLAFSLVPQDLLLNQLPQYLPYLHLGFLALPFLSSVIWGACVALPYFAVFFFDRDGYYALRWPFYILALLTLMVTWFLSALAFWFSAQALIDLSIETFSTFFFVLAVALNIGLIVLVAPGGLGVREAIMVFLLSTSVPAPLATALALLSRVTIVISEFVMAFMVIWLGNKPVFRQQPE